MKACLKHYLETLRLELQYCQTAEDYKFLERIIIKLEDILRRG